MKTRIVHAQAFIEDKTRDVENTKTERVASNAEPKIKTKNGTVNLTFPFYPGIHAFHPFSLLI